MADTFNSTDKLAFLGAGRMATALAKGFVSSGLVAGEQIVGAARSEASRTRFTQTVPGAQATGDNQAAIDGAAVVFLGVKPQMMDTLLREIGKAIPSDALVVSIAAGLQIARLAAKLPRRARIVRVMPNTPCLIGRGASGFSLGEHATPGDAELISQLMGAVGYAAQVDESLLGAVTGVSGSGPAFVYTFIEAMADAGVRAGLPRTIAYELAARTTAGAADMVTTTGEHPATLRDAVTSPGGTTAAGLAALERERLPWSLHAAVEATIQRSQELADG